jgi:hypothetical protein
MSRIRNTELLSTGSLQCFARGTDIIFILRKLKITDVIEVPERENP